MIGAVANVVSCARRVYQRTHILYPYTYTIAIDFLFALLEFRRALYLSLFLGMAFVMHHQLWITIPNFSIRTELNNFDLVQPSFAYIISIFLYFTARCGGVGGSAAASTSTSLFKYINSNQRHIYQTTQFRTCSEQKRKKKHFFFVVEIVFLFLFLFFWYYYLGKKLFLTSHGNDGID